MQFVVVYRDRKPFRGSISLHYRRFDMPYKSSDSSKTIDTELWEPCFVIFGSAAERAVEWFMRNKYP